MAVIFEKISLRKAGFIVCLFLLPGAISQAQPHRIVRAELYHGHFTEAVFHFKKRGARDWKAAYYGLWGSTLQALLDGNEKAKTKYELFLEAFEIHLDTLRTTEEAYHFLKTEFYLHQALVEVRYGSELDALFSFRQAFNLAQEGMEDFPDFYPIRKSMGVVMMVLGVVPDDYQWIMSLLGWNGSIRSGLDYLDELYDDPDFGAEAKLYSYLAQSYLLDQHHIAAEKMKVLFEEQNKEMLFRYFYMALLAKDSQAQAIIDLSDYLDPAAIIQTHFLLGEAHMQKAEYDSALYYYQFFLDFHSGQDLVKDTHYKMFLCYKLMGDQVRADSTRSVGLTLGSSKLESDKYASSNLKAHDSNDLILKARFATDGGFYSLAQEYLDEFYRQFPLTDPNKLSKVQCESIYRQARIFHKLGKTNEALKLYEETVLFSSDNPWYFAPNAALQMGLIYYEEGDLDEAKTWFIKARSYKRHEYKRSIDQKAKSILSIINTTEK